MIRMSGGIKKVLAQCLCKIMLIEVFNLFHYPLNSTVPKVFRVSERKVTMPLTIMGDIVAYWQNTEIIN